MIEIDMEFNSFGYRRELRIFADSLVNVHIKLINLWQLYTLGSFFVFHSPAATAVVREQPIRNALEDRQGDEYIFFHLYE